MKLVIIDYGIGNLRSIEKAFTAVGVDGLRTDRPEDVEEAEKLVLPGVGAFGACAEEIRRRGLVEPILRSVEAGKPFLGVCVGMQLLFDVGEEMGEHRGLGILPGRVARFDARAAVHTVAGPADDGTPGWDPTLKIPHMGWNTIVPRSDSPLLQGLPHPAYFYFVHSFVAVPDDPADVLASCHYGASFAAMVQRNNVYGVQFHPEKSQQNGLRILRSFAELT